METESKKNVLEGSVTLDNLEEKLRITCEQADLLSSLSQMIVDQIKGEALEEETKPEATPVASGILRNVSATIERIDRLTGNAIKYLSKLVN